MILIIGGSSQGKTQFAKTLLKVEEDKITDGGSCVLEEAFTGPVLNKLQVLIQRLKEADFDAGRFILEGIKKNPEITIICDELGLGVVPVEQKDRERQELIGRIQCQIAQKADKVYRVHCSIPVLIKG